jgi:hypothetical protein
VAPRHASSEGLRIRRFVLKPKILDEGDHIAIAGCHAGQPLGVFERGRDIPCVAAEADQREQGFAIAGVAHQDVFQNGHGLAFPTGRMQPDGIDARQQQKSAKVVLGHVINTDGVLGAHT